MKINTVTSTNNQNFTGNTGKAVKGIKAGKAANLAYSAFFTLALLSAGNNFSNKDVFIKNNNVTEQNENQLQPLPRAAIKAQTIYTDGLGQQWVKYEDYRKQYNEYTKYSSYIESYINDIKEDSHEIDSMSKKIQEYKPILENLNKLVPKTEQKWLQIRSETMGLREYYDEVKDGKNIALTMFGVLGVIAALITRGLYKLGRRILGKK